MGGNWDSIYNINSLKTFCLTWHPPDCWQCLAITSFLTHTLLVLIIATHPNLEKHTHRKNGSRSVLTKPKSDWSNFKAKDTLIWGPKTRLHTASAKIWQTNFNFWCRVWTQCFTTEPSHSGCFKQKYIFSHHYHFCRISIQIML